MLRSAVILIEDGQLALIRRERDGLVYFLLPGGRVEKDESLTEAAYREAEEELGLRVRIGRLVAEVLYQGKRQFYFLAQRNAGEFGHGGGTEMLGLAEPESGTYQAVWLPLKSLLDEPVYPRELCRLIVNAEGGPLPETSVSIRDEGRNRQGTAAE